MIWSFAVADDMAPRQTEHLSIYVLSHNKISLGNHKPFSSYQIVAEADYTFSENTWYTLTVQYNDEGKFDVFVDGEEVLSNCSTSYLSNYQAMCFCFNETYRIDDAKMWQGEGPFSPANNPPVADAGPDQTVAGGETVTLDGSGSSDSDADSLSYRWTQIAGASVTLSDSTAVTPTFVAPEGPDTLSFMLVVDDGQGKSDADTVNVYVASISGPRVLRVPSQYPTIQAGIDAAADGDTVLVDNGIYTENVILRNGVVLRTNADSTIITATSGNVVSADGVTDAVIEGFNISCGGQAVHGISCQNGATLIIRDNQISDAASRGINCEGGSSPQIIQNTITGSTYNGINCGYSAPTIEGNEIAENSVGINCWEAAPTVRDNHIHDNGDGIWCYAGSSVLIYSNIIENNTGYGIFTHTSSPIIGGSLAHANTIYQNRAVRLDNGADDIDATYNYWGTSDESVIQTLIWDHTDNSALGTVHYTPWTDETHTQVLTGGPAPKVLRVPSQYATIQAGIDAAAAGDTVLVADGTYMGAGNKGLNFNGKAIVVMSENGPEVTIIDCKGNGRGFSFYSGEGSTSVVKGFTVDNGSASDGGGIHCTGSSPKITSNILSNNSAQYSGGGIYCYIDSSPTIISNIFSGNSAGIYGGAIYCDSNASPEITHSIFSSNSAGSSGGGISCWEDSSPKIVNCIFSSNFASESSGGISCYNNSSPTILNTILWGDTSGEIYLDSSTITITYSDIQGGYTGEGNINADPLFVDPDNGDYHLQAGSPCINAGDPSSPLDPDGTRADMGALYYD